MDKELRKLLMFYCRPYFVYFFGLLVLTLTTNSFQFIIPRFYKELIDSAIPGRDFEGVIILLLGLSFLQYLHQFFVYIETIIVSKIKKEISIKLKTDIYNRIQQLPINLHSKSMTSESVSRILYDSENIQSFFGKTLIDLLCGAAFFVVMIPFMMLIDVEITLYLLIIIPITYSIYRFFSSKILLYGTKLTEDFEKYTGLLQQNLASVKEIKSSNISKIKSDEVTSKTTEIETTRQKITVNTAKYSLFTILPRLCTNFIIWGLGGFKVINGDITIGSLLVLVFYSRFASESISTLFRSVLDFSRYSPSLKRISTLILQPSSEDLKTGLLVPKRKWKCIEIENLGFFYETNQPVLQNLNLVIKENSCVLITGKSGIGKSTLIDILMRFYKPTAGSIKINGRCINEYNLVSYRQLFSIVYQNSPIFNSSIIENIVLGASNISKNKLDWILKLTGLDEIETKMKDGLHSVVGECGNILSEGQKQKISIARSLVRHSPIMIFDEATSNLDKDSELEIVKLLNDMKGSRTIIVIAHKFPKELLRPDIHYVIGESGMTNISDCSSFKNKNDKPLEDRVQS